ncbi:hypothetical protein [Erythrobacter sp. WG]|uniref:hypothetical protein n=1 Tax=Erythrobacter sp. WG TaxID=2985510 RepID=UPI00226EECA0|nr:hypothetical protein [Erythrobacter sp. WG]MCX9146062.1 hypothetical protein [Erythrobacter sp. WG]
MAEAAEIEITDALVEAGVAAMQEAHDAEAFVQIPAKRLGVLARELIVAMLRAATKVDRAAPSL